MKTYYEYLSENLSDTEREKLQKELDDLNLKMKGDFVSPKDYRRKEEIEKLLLFGTTNVTIKKGHNPERVTSFTRNRR